MPSITKEAEKALMEISREKSGQISDLKANRALVNKVARDAIRDGLSGGAIAWRNALERIKTLTD